MLYICAINGIGKAKKSVWYCCEVMPHNEYDLVKDHNRAVKMTESQKNTFKKYYESCGYKVTVVESSDER